MKDVSIIIPVFNESDVIKSVVNELLEYKFPFSTEILIINDGSTDNSLIRINEIKISDDVKVISNLHNRGYGFSLKKGIRNARGKYIVTYDGDGQFFPEDIERLFKEGEKNNYDAVIGERSRLSSGSPIWRAPGKFFLRFMINNLLNVKLKDFNCGLRLVKREVINKYLHLCSDKFSFSTTSTMILINRGYEVSFLPIKIRDRNKGKSAVKIYSGLSTMYLIIKMVMLFNPFKIFFYLGALFLILGFVWGGNYLLMDRGLSMGSLLFILVGTLSFFLGLIADQISELRKSQFED